MKQVVLTRAALADLTAIYEHIGADSLRYAVAVVDRLTKRSQQLAAFPQSGQMVPEYQREDIREIIEYSYRMLYQDDGSVVSIIALIHGSHLLPDSPPSSNE
jgi:toxin ParE1/3/4